MSKCLKIPALYQTKACSSSAETMLNQSTVPYLSKIHNEVVNDMKCSRHEIHPMYPSDFASQLNVLSLKEMKEAIHHLLDI